MHGIWKHNKNVKICLFSSKSQGPVFLDFKLQILRWNSVLQLSSDQVFVKFLVLVGLFFALLSFLLGLSLMSLPSAIICLLCTAKYKPSS